jgi:hypothetical protein
MGEAGKSVKANKGELSVESWVRMFVRAAGAGSEECNL